MTATAILGFVRSISASYLDAKVLSPAELADPVVTLVLRMVGARADTSSLLTRAPLNLAVRGLRLLEMPGPPFVTQGRLGAEQHR